MKLTTSKRLKKPQTFDELFADDPYDLLANIGEKRASMSVSERVKSSFEKVAAFVKANKRLPFKNDDDFEEEILATEYESLIKQFPEGQAYCASLLPENSKQAPAPAVIKRCVSKKEQIASKVSSMSSRLYENIEDVINDDPLGLLNDVGESKDRHEYWREQSSGESSSRAKSADHYVAKAVECKEFYRYERFFNEANELLKEKHLMTKDIPASNVPLGLGDIFVVGGMMSIVAAVDDEKNVIKNKYGNNEYTQYRVRQIFANRKESYPFNISLKRTFYKKGIVSKRIVPADDIGFKFTEEMKAALTELSSGSGNNVFSGFIYILGSLSTNSVIKKFVANSQLVKIGYTTTSVRTRIANAENEATYLYAPVRILKTYKCLNFDARNLEDVLHTLLARQRLNITLKDKDGKVFKPREWFTVGFETADAIIQHIFEGDIDKYYIDNIQGKLRKKGKAEG